MSGSKWWNMVCRGARFNYIKYIVKLFHFKKSEQNNSNKNKLSYAEIKEDNLNYNKFGYPFYSDKDKIK